MLTYEEAVQKAKESDALKTAVGREAAATYRIIARAIDEMETENGETINDIEVALKTHASDNRRAVYATEAARMLKGADAEIVRPEYPHIVEVCEECGLA